MTVRRLLSPLIGITLVVAAGAAAYATSDRWVPYVFPAPPPADALDHADDHDHAAHPDRVKLSPQAQQNLKLDVATLTPRAYWRTTLIPGVVVDRPGESDRGVAARLAGVVLKIHAKPGDAVTAGEPLFALQLVGEVVQGLQADLAKAARELAIAAAARDRAAKLVEDKISPPATLIDPDNQLKRATTLVHGLRRQLQTFGLTAAQLTKAEAGEPVTEVTVAAPGQPDPAASAADRPAVYEVQELKVTLGETVAAGAALCTLARHDQLYVEGRAFKSEATALARLAERQTPVRAEFADEAAGEWPDQPPLTVRHLSNVVDPATRTFAFYLPLDNQPRTFARDGRTHFVWRYRPGQRVRLKVPVEPLGDAVLVLPAGAVVREGAEAFAFVQNGDTFVRKPVRVLYEDRTDVVLANDGSLPGGAFVARNQAAALNRALKAAAAEGGGHGHSHEH